MPGLTGHPHRPVRTCPGDPGPGEGHLPRPCLQPVLLLGDPVGAERVRFDDIGPGGDVGLMDGRDDVRPRQVQAFVVPFQQGGGVFEGAPAEIFFRQGIPLDLGPGRSVQAEHPFPEGLL